MTAAYAAQSRWAILARLVRPQGRRGEIVAELLTDFPERFAERRALVLLPSETSETPVREAALESHWLHKGRIVLKLAGVDSITEAESLRGLLVGIPASQRVALTDGSVYIGDLIGCEIIDLNADSAKVGIVAEVDSTAALLSVTTPSGAEVLVPFAKEYLVTMDLEGGRIEMRLPEGLLDIDAPMTDEERTRLDES